MVKKINIFIIHTKYTPERKQIIRSLTELVKSYNFRNIKIQGITIVDEYDPNEINAPLITKIVSYDRIQEPHLEIYNQLLRNLHVNQLSNTLKHMTALEKASKAGDNDYNIILEDDVLSDDKMCLAIERLLTQLPTKFDILFLGMPTVNEMKVTTEYQFQNTKNIFRVLPLCDSYLISTKIARNIVANYAPIKFVNNIQLSFVLDKLGLTSQQCIPNIFIDGSKFGMFVSRISPNNPLIFNNDYTNFNQLLAKSTLQKDDHDKIKTLITSSQIKQNPDFIHLICRYHTLCNNYKEAQQCFEEAYNIFVSSGCVITNETVFLKDYIRLHKYLQ